jgi:hypothetical protein
MKTLFFPFKYIAAMLLLLTTVCAAQAQYKTKRIGNKPREGSANSSFDLHKGNQLGVKMNIGHKPVQLLKFHFDVENNDGDTLKFKVNVYNFEDGVPGEKLFTQEITGSVPTGEHYVTVDLEPYNLQAKGTVLVAIEMLKNYGGDVHFHIGLFNGGTWRYKENHWKKIPIVGVDFNMLVRKV